AGAGNVLVSATGTLTVNGLTTINLTGSTGAGSYTLIDYTGSALTAAQFANLTIGTKPSDGRVYVLFNNTANTSVDLISQLGGASNTWTGALNGTWTPISGDPANAANWTIAYADGQQVLFDDTGSNTSISGTTVAPQTITV